MSDWEAVLRTPELGPGQRREVEAHGRTLMVSNVGQAYYAVDAHCVNDGTNLARDGLLRGAELSCPTDGWVYDVRTGRRIEPSGGPGLAAYPVRVERNDVMVGPAGDGTGANEAVRGRS